MNKSKQREIDMILDEDFKPDDYKVLDKKTGKEVKMTDFIDAIEVIEGYENLSKGALKIFKRMYKL